MLANRLCAVSMFLLACLIGTPLFAAEPKLAVLLERSPSPANAVAYVHFPSLKKLMADANMMAKITDNLDEVWLVSELEIARLRPRWEVGYAVLKQAADAKKLADGVNGYVDTVADKEVVWSPSQSYLVPMSDARLGFLRPANRALLAEWIDPGVNVNPTGYLTDQVKQPEQYLSLMMAVDLKDAFSPVPLGQRLEDFDALSAQQPESVASILASIQGVSIIVGRTSLSQCILTADFGKSPASLLPIASKLLSEMLTRNGTAAPEVATWKASVKGNQLAFEGPITEDSLDAVLGIFSVRSQAERVAESMSDPIKLKKSEDNRIAYTSKNYFDDITAVIERTRKHQSQTTGARAKWNDQQARRIDEMGTLNVDPMLVQYSSDVANLLRGNALTIRKGNMAAGATKAAQGLYNNYGGYYSGYYDSNTSSDYKRVTDVQTRTAAYADYASVLNEIDQRTAEVRRALTEKYKIQF